MGGMPGGGMFGMPAPADLASNLQVCVLSETASCWCCSHECGHAYDRVFAIFQ